MTLNIHKISLQRGNTDILVNFSFQVAAGEVVQILGENGSGKTSLLRCLTGLIPITEGDIRWQDQSIYACTPTYNQALIYIGHTHALMPMLTARENLLMDACMYQHPMQQSVDTVLETLDLQRVSHLRTDCLSAGQQRKLALARLFIFKSSLWILDEPFVTLDQKSCQILEAKMIEHSQTGNMIIFTSHQSFQLNHLPVKKVWLQNEN